MGHTIKLYLKEVGLSQAYLAGKIGLRPSTLNSILNGERRLEIEKYLEICDVLKVPYDTFAPRESTSNFSLETITDTAQTGLATRRGDNV